MKAVAFKHLLSILILVYVYLFLEILIWVSLIIFW